MPSGQFRSGAVDGSEGASAPESSGGKYGLRLGAQWIPIRTGETLFGRDESCQVVLNGALVSRRHARILLDGGELTIEDLKSTNGTFLNGAKVQGRLPLRPGDRLFVGSFEIDVVHGEVEVPESGITGNDPFERMTPSSGLAPVGRIAIARGRNQLGPATQPLPTPNPLELDWIESAGRLAERMFALGRPLAGRDVLSEPLNEILAAVRREVRLDDSVLDAAGRLAMKLAQEVYDEAWVNLTIETHLLAGHAMKTETLQQLIALRKKAPIGDDDLIARYHARLSAMFAFMPLAERLLYAELVGHDSTLDIDE